MEIGHIDTKGIIVPLAWKSYCSKRKTRGRSLFFPIVGKGGVVVLTERSEVKTAPPDRERVKHSPEGFSFTAVTFSG